MLLSLKVQNFVIVESLEINFQSGLCVLTGETGAGKSLLLDALMGVIGQRTPSDLIRQGKPYAYLEAHFTWSPEIIAFLKAEQFDEITSEPHLIMSRTIQKQGSKSRLNGQLVSQKFARQLGRLLVDSVGQHDNQTLFDDEAHLGLLDALGSAGHQTLIKKTAETYGVYQSITQALRQIDKAYQQRLREKDFVQFQAQEIESAELESDEDYALEAEALTLRHADGIRQDVNAAYYELYDSNPSICERLEGITSKLNRAVEVAPGLEPLAKILEDAYLQVYETSRDILAYGEELETNPQRLDEIEERLSLLTTLKNKYGPTLAGVIDYAAELAEKLDALSMNEEQTSVLKLEQVQAKNAYLKQAQSLHDSRLKLSQKYAPQIEKELRLLGMPKVQFEIAVEQLAETWQGSGQDKVCFLLCPNPGESMKPLSKIASGGEASRLLLVMKMVLQKAQKVPTLLLDEIDTGISGKTALVVSKKLAELAQYFQVICISHLPVIAGMAEQQLWVEKEQNDQSTELTIEVLNHGDRIEKLAQMASGKITEPSLKNAREIIETARQFHETLKVN